METLEERIEKAKRIDDRNPGIHLSRKCAVCGMPKTPNVWLCNACQDEFGQSKDWPEWVRFMVNDHRRELRYDKEHKDEIDF